MVRDSGSLCVRSARRNMNHENSDDHLWKPIRKNQPKLDKNAELLKVSLLSDEIRTRHFAVIGMWITFMIAFLAGDISLLSLTDKTVQMIYLVGFVVAAFYIIRQIREASLKYLNR